MVICTGSACRGVPYCITNFCPYGSPIIDQTNFQAIQCSSDTDCNLLGLQSFCYIFGDSSGYCCWHSEKGSFPVITSKIGACPQISVNSSSCHDNKTNDCTNDNDCNTVRKYEKDEYGCDSCRCHNPCNNIICPSTHVCRLIDVKCLKRNCEPIPKCILNVCPEGEPLTLPSGQRLILCHIDDNHLCPVAISQAVCPTVFENELTDYKSCSIQCRTHNDCSFGKCCFNGCGTSCFSSAEKEVNKDTPCIHKLAYYNGEDKKLSIYGPRIECNEDGSFKSVQCDQQIRYCWCVNTKSGEELLGSRVMAAVAEPNCEAPNACSTKCDGISCSYGFRLDVSGCPLDGLCECKNPCEDIKCARKKDVCVLMPVACITSPCPLMPLCKSSPCSKHSKPLRDKNNNVLSCVRNHDCDKGSCKLLPNERTHGICCFSDCSVECSSNSACDGMKLCCDYGCAKICVHPENTNCIQLYSVIRKLTASGAIVNLHTPECDENTGLFKTLQCDESNNCWCVDSVTGVVAYGSTMKLLESFTNIYDICSSEPNPCDGPQKPALDEKTYIHWPCNKDHSKTCPRGYYCTGYDETSWGERRDGKDFTSCPYGIDMDLYDSFTDMGKVMDTYQLGFSLTGPLLRERHQHDINKEFHMYLTKKFNIDYGEVSDIIIDDNNTVQFFLTGEDAKLKANNISDSCLLCDRKEIRRSVSTRHYLSRIGHGAQTPIESNQNSGTFLEQFEHEVASGSDEHCGSKMHHVSNCSKLCAIPQTPGGRRRSRTTVYY
ncbi:unnamed protein product [Thelazia callipaeda]|uniref:Thyroglobulin type-1 domain-containing protein n=1 Tax=Thelazia callipaeda TaxID=103827 RepID=A0A0N5D0X1_THECL|nr:unnamed protein product [Thelazia callipaeda]